MTRLPKITIVTPSFNSGKYIEKCILSIREQNYKNYEHIIIDGGSTDNTLDILKKYEKQYPMRWISEPDDGMYDAINKGFSMADGDIFAWLNADDYYFPWTLQVVAKAFERRDIHWLTGMPSVTKYFENTWMLYLVPNLPVVYHQGMIRRGVYDGRTMYFIQQESCFWSRELWNKSGGLNNRYKMAGDYFLWKAFAREEPLYTIHCNLASFRIHAGQKTDDMDGYYLEMGRKKYPSIFCKLLLMYLHVYSLCNYKKYVINIDEIFCNV